MQLYALEYRVSWNVAQWWYLVRRHRDRRTGTEQKKIKYEEEPFPRQIQSCCIPTALVFSALQQPYLLLLYLCSECNAYTQEPARYGDTLENYLYYYSACSIAEAVRRRNNFSFFKSMNGYARWWRRQGCVWCAQNDDTHLNLQLIKNVHKTYYFEVKMSMSINNWIYFP